MNIFQKFKRWLMDTSPEPDPIEYAQWETEGGTTPEQNEAHFAATGPKPTGPGPRPYGWSTGPHYAGGYRTAPVVAVDDTSDCLTVAASAAVAAMLAESTPPACPYCETAIPPAAMPSTDVPLESPSPSSDTPDCGGSSCDCSCGGDQ
jgi:hypothetical protein